MPASSLGISSWIPLKSDVLTSPTTLIIPHRPPAFLDSLTPLRNWCWIHARWSKSSLKHSIRFCGIFPRLKQNFITYRSSKVSSRPDCIFEIHQMWQSGFSRVYSNCCCNCSFELEIIKIGQSSCKMYSNNILTFQGSTTILNDSTKRLETCWRHHVYIYIYIYGSKKWIVIRQFVKKNWKQVNPSWRDLLRSKVDTITFRF